MTQEIIKNEVLRSLVSADDHEKRYSDLKREVWERIRNLEIIAYNSFKSTLLTRALKNLITESIICKIFRGHGNVSYRINDLEKANARIYSLDLRNAIAELIGVEVSRGELFMEMRNFLTQILVQPFWAKICEAKISGNKENYDFYKEEGKRVSAYLFGIMAEILFESPVDEYRTQAYMEFVSSFAMFSGHRTEQAVIAESFFNKPTDKNQMVQWLRLKAKGLLKQELPSNVKERTAETFFEEFQKRVFEQTPVDALPKKMLDYALAQGIKKEDIEKIMRYEFRKIYRGQKGSETSCRFVP